MCLAGVSVRRVDDIGGVVLKRIWADQVTNVSVLEAIGISEDGFHQVFAVIEGAKEDKAGWSGFLRHLKNRSVTGITTDH